MVERLRGGFGGFGCWAGRGYAAAFEGWGADGARGHGVA